MKVIYYSRPCFLDHAFLQVKALSRFCDLYFFVEGSHNNHWYNIIEIGKVPNRCGLYNADEILYDLIPPHLWSSYFTKLCGFKFVGYRKGIFFDPLTWFENLKVSREMINFLKGISPHIVHFDDLSMRSVFLIIRLRKNLPHVPIVLTIHDTAFHSGERDIKKEIMRRIAFKYVNHYILHSAFCQREFLNKYNIPSDRTSVIYMGTLDAFVEWHSVNNVNERENMVLYFGRISPYKGLDTLAKAIPIVEKEIANVLFVIAGQPINNYTLPDLIATGECKSAKIKLICRYITNYELATLLKQATVVVVPYNDASQSGVVLTAYAFNKPVVATSVGGLPEVVEHGKTGLLVPPKDPESLAQALCAIIKNKEMRISMKEQIRKKREEILSWDNIALQKVSVYEKCLFKY